MHQNAFTDDPENMSIRRVVTCGSVDDGKSTLMGRMLYDSKAVPDDQLAALERDSRRVGTVPSGLDYALLFDGLQAEREQGITIDVAYRHFATPRRRFLVADSPGHEQYTRNMATGASTAELAVLLVDARNGLVQQTLRHSYITQMMGIDRVILAVNKMDLVGYDEAVFRGIEGMYTVLAHGLGIPNVSCIPVSALNGDNVVFAGTNMPWYEGHPLLTALETAEAPPRGEDGPFRMAVQWVNRPSSDFRGYCGTITSGRITPGASLRIHPDGPIATVDRVYSINGPVHEAVAGEPVTLTMTKEVDIRRGQVLADPADSNIQVADQFAAHVLWMDEQPMIPGRSLLVRLGTAVVPATVTEIKHRVNINTQEHQAAKTLEMNDVGFCNLALDRTAPFLPFAQSRELGTFVIIDRITNATVGAGTIDFALRRSSNIAWQPIAVDKAARAALNGQKPCAIWLTGLSGSGKSTIANLIEQKLFADHRRTYILDGDNVRHGLNRDLGFTEADRVENIRRAAQVARLFVDAGTIVIVSFISPFRAERRMARELFDEGEFIEVFVDTPLEECERRDPKGLYGKARAGNLKNFTGIDSPYQVPEAPELTIKTATLTPEQSADAVLSLLRNRGVI